MDIFMRVFDTLIILSFSILIAFITPFIMGVLRKRNYDIFIQLIPVFSIIWLSSFAISIAMGGLQELLFFRIVFWGSLIGLIILLLLTLAIRILWKEKYDAIIEWVLSLHPKNDRSFSLK
ncbi:hypothetical protein [Sporosarcina highlanderae]|uniref:DUF1616 domain-containing protein n=1 Tax=Sporosarcina highlanderae TaxID=3035916 RepID=A0ABT8JN92_9BACL|nr:hypothetical protein [Sporosarcina highlanderae]MDN4606283.1 hypothetical protein [Sporosarcina highlanderae]